MKHGYSTISQLMNIEVRRQLLQQHPSVWQQEYVNMGLDYARDMLYMLSDHDNEEGQSIKRDMVFTIMETGASVENMLVTRITETLIAMAHVKRKTLSPESLFQILRTLRTTNAQARSSHPGADTPRSEWDTLVREITDALRR